MTQNEVKNLYFEWLYTIACGNRFPKEISYRKLLMLLHQTEFRYHIPKDENRYEDGIDLRYRFALMTASHEDLVEAIVDDLVAPCSVLEMLIALSLRCEENIMDDPQIGDRTGQWFWGMINNLKLGAMSDEHFDKEYAIQRIDIFLDRKYQPNGEGGLFRLNHCDIDLREVEIWSQLCWYLDSFN